MSYKARGLICLIKHEKNKINIPSFKDFHAQLDCKLTYGNKNQTQLTLVQYIKFSVKKKKQNKTEMMKT